ncbi:MAG: hypothetical protein K2F57_01110 [Candidatus Gastranaerophilales bacterium]|nr:hypothetical protein [Candidatus Gastranaerophilales bacterium]
MRIQNIQYTTGNISFNNKNTLPKQDKYTNPTKEAIKTTGVWLGFGLGFDFVCRKFIVFKNSPTKNSLLINSIVALAAGSYTLMKELKDKK